MKRLGTYVLLAAAALLALLVLAGCAGRRGAGMAPLITTPLIAPHAQAIDLAKGDAARGRSAFIALRCHACHRVAEDDSLPRVEGASDGPVLRNLGAESAEAVAWKIVTTTSLAPDAIHESEMAESASAMTEQQLVDVVAYLRNPAGARPQ